ncbi:MAG: hypothetical protein QOK05_2985 [Chloroflexota bacterium]|nr:hypothetical protein [Chloroflexota bacterium]
MEIPSDSPLPDPSPYRSFAPNATRETSPTTVLLTVIGGVLALVTTALVALRVSGAWTGGP